MPRLRFPLMHLLPLAALPALGGAQAQTAEPPADPAALQRAIAEAQSAGAAAGSRAATLEARAAAANAAVEKTANEAAGIAARIQQAEARIAAGEARASLIEQQRAGLRRQLAAQQRPLVELTAALQRLSRRPAGFALLRPGSLSDAVYLRAALEAMLPAIERRTASVRGALARSRALHDQARANVAGLRQASRELSERRNALAALETRQQLEARSASGLAARESDRALALAERARDLSVLVQTIDQASQSQAELAALPGPVIRPAVPSAVAAPQVAGPTQAAAPARLAGFILPMNGRLVAGFGAERAGQPRSRGVTLAVRPGAQAVAPAAGRVSFAASYRGYGRIAIIDHGGGWTSLVTGLATLDVAVGERVVAGSPLGNAGPGAPQVTLELRRGGEPVNPLDQLGG